MYWIDSSSETLGTPPTPPDSSAPKYESNSFGGTEFTTQMLYFPILLQILMKPMIGFKQNKIGLVKTDLVAIFVAKKNSINTRAEIVMAPCRPMPLWGYNPVCGRISPHRGHDCVKSPRSSYTWFFAQSPPLRPGV